jgi:shikimate 5-dehydrogenase
VAVTGVIFFGSGGAAHAFVLSLVELTVLASGIVVTSRLLPRRAA